MKITLPDYKSLLLHPSLQMGLILCASLPFFFFLFSFFLRLQESDLIEERFTALYAKSLQRAAIDERETAFLTRLKKADRRYLDEQLEALTFLKPEILKLKHSPQEDRSRLSFLEKQNRLIFAEEGRRQANGIQEVEERQLHPIEVNEEDLKQLLYLIEHPSQESAPQLIVQDFRLTKKTISPNHAVFLLNMRLIKREGISP